MRQVPTTPPLTVVPFDEGGMPNQHDANWRAVAAQGGPVKILGMCQSACTMVLAHIPKDRLCFGEDRISISITRD